MKKILIFKKERRKRRTKTIPSYTRLFTQTSFNILQSFAKVDRFSLNIFNCERALDAMALKYINGDSAIGIKQHHVPVYENKKLLDEKGFQKC